MGKETKSTVNLIVTIAVALIGVLILWGIFGTIRKEGKSEFNSVYQTIDESKLALNTAIANFEEDVDKKLDKVKSSVVVFDNDTDEDFKALNEKVDATVTAKAQEISNQLTEVANTITSSLDDHASNLNDGHTLIYNKVVALESKLDSALEILNQISSQYLSN